SSAVLGVLEPKSDLSVSLVRTNVITASIAAGTTIAVTSSVANVGGAAAPSVSVSIMLSTNPVITVQDLELGTYSVSLDAGRAHKDVTMVTIPADVATGTYWVGALADPMNQIQELSKSNNGRAAAA